MAKFRNDISDVRFCLFWCIRDMYTLLENGTQSGALHGPSGISGITFSMALGGESFNVACERVACALPVRALSGHWPRILATGEGGGIRNMYTLWKMHTECCPAWAIKDIRDYIFHGTGGGGRGVLQEYVHIVSIRPIPGLMRLNEAQ